MEDISLILERPDFIYLFIFCCCSSSSFLLFFLSFFFPLRGGDGGGGEGVFIPVQYLEFSDLSSIGINGIINSRICRRIASVANMVRNSDKSISISSRIKSIYIMNVYKKNRMVKLLIMHSLQRWNRIRENQKWTLLQMSRAKKNQKKTTTTTKQQLQQNDTGFCSNCRSVVRRVSGFRCCFQETAAAATPSSDNEPPVK